MATQNCYVSITASVELDPEEFDFKSVEEMNAADLEEHLSYSQYKHLLDIVHASGTMIIQKDETVDQI